MGPLGEAIPQGTSAPVLDGTPRGGGRSQCQNPRQPALHWAQAATAKMSKPTSEPSRYTRACLRLSPALAPSSDILNEF